jgi:hypothetical protein
LSPDEEYLAFLREQLKLNETIINMMVRVGVYTLKSFVEFSLLPYEYVFDDLSPYDLTCVWSDFMLVRDLNEGRINRAQFHYVVQAIQRNPPEWRQIYPANETAPDWFQVYLPRPVMFIPVDMSQAYRNVEESSVELEMTEDEVPGGSTDSDREESSDDEAPVPTLPGGNDIVAAFRRAVEEEIAVVSQTYGPWSELNDESENETDDEEQALSSASTNPSIATARVVNMAATVRTGTRDVHIEERLGMNMRALLTSMMPHIFYCISDVGDDTTIFGNGWVVIGFSRRRGKSHRV